MKPGGTFALNPHAASYVPLSKRVDDMDGLATRSMQGREQIFMPKTSSEMAYKQIRDDDDLDMEMDIDMDIEYLLVTFSGLSQESITDVYLANSGDLEATIEMLNQLEVSSSVISRDHSHGTLYFCYITDDFDLSCGRYTALKLKNTSQRRWILGISVNQGHQAQRRQHKRRQLQKSLYRHHRWLFLMQLYQPDLIYPLL